MISTNLSRCWGEKEMRGKDNSQLIIRICEWLIIVGVALTPFMSINMAWIPTPIKMFINYESCLSMYPLLLLGVIWFVVKARNRELKDYIPLAGFFIIYFITNIIIVIHGDITYPYYQLADYSKLEGGDAVAYQVISSILPFSNKNNWIISNILKSCLTITTKFICSYFVLFSIYLFYKDTQKDFVTDTWIGITIILPVLAIYAVFEYAYLFGHEFGAKVLALINPLLYEVQPDGYWWPPLYWNQVRSVFAEPSYLSYWGAACLPLFMTNIQAKKRVLLNTIELLFITLLVLSAFARSGTALTIGCYCVFIFLDILKNKRQSISSVAIILLVFVISIAAASQFVSASETSELVRQSTNSTSLPEKGGNNEINESSKTGIQTYLTGTVGTLVNSSARSNSSRFGMIKSQVSLFTKHPILGVSEQLIGNHIIEAFDELDPSEVSGEMELWTQTQLSGNCLSTITPKLNQYTYSLAYGGLLGFSVNVLPFLILAFACVWRYFMNTSFRDDKSLCILSMISVIVAFGLSDIFDLNYLFFITFGLLLIISPLHKTKQNNSKKASCLNERRK